VSAPRRQEEGGTSFLCGACGGDLPSTIDLEWRSQTDLGSVGAPARANCRRGAGVSRSSGDPLDEPGSIQPVINSFLG
jgi:hypothetical protein